MNKNRTSAVVFVSLLHAYKHAWQHKDHTQGAIADGTVDNDLLYLAQVPVMARKLQDSGHKFTMKPWI